MTKYGIKDYEADNKRLLNNIMNHKDISKKNKNALNRFLKAYIIKKGAKKGQPVSLARKNLFLTQIPKLLTASKDIIKDMQDRDKINDIFNDFRNKLSPGYYGTVVNLSLRFVRWLNDNEKPKGFKDIDNVSKDQQKRNMKPEEHWEWDDAITHSKTAFTVQEKAWAPVRLDAGCRAAEFLGLNYGDVKKKNGHMIIHINGKTGKRDTILYQAVPWLDEWLREHPTKKTNDPLWVMQKKGEILRYTYAAHNKRFRSISKLAKLNKPNDFNATRHSCARLTKIDNMNPLQASENLGHSLEYYQRTYGQLTTEDRLKSMEEHNGTSSKEEKK